MTDSEIDMFSPCPFCGSSDLRIVNFSSGVKCEHCGVTVTLSSAVIRSAGKKQNRVIALASYWNKRVA